MSEPEWRRAVRPASKRDHFNVRVISRAHDGTLIVMDLSEVPKEKWIDQFGGRGLAEVRSIAAKDVPLDVPPFVEHLVDFVGRGLAAQAEVDEIIKKASP